MDGNAPMLIAPIPVTLKDGRTVVLRSPHADDADAMRAFRKVLLAESADNLNHFADGADHVSEDDQRALLQRVAEAPNTFFLAAFAGEAIVGNIGLHPEAAPRLTHVASIGMGSLRAYHGCGLGTALMRAAIRHAPEAGFWNLKLTVRTFNTAGIALYERCGFERVGTLKAIARVGDGYADEHLYQLLLTP
jgi:RimJ/RimL family protein N-acetyltransferase